MLECWDRSLRFSTFAGVGTVRSLAFLLISLFLVSRPAGAATLHTDTFDTPGSTLGWEGGFPLPVHIATGGPAGVGDGYMKVIASESSAHLASYNLGVNWTGSYSSIGATRVTADLMNPVDSAPLDVRLVLFTTNGARWTSNVAQAVPPDGIWRNYVFSIAEASLTQAQGSDTYAQMMASIDRAMFRHQSGAPISQGTPVFHPSDFNTVSISEGDFKINESDLTHPVRGFNVRFGIDLDGSNFLAWQRTYGGPIGTLNVDNARLAASSSVAVPEPTLVLAAGAGLLVARRRLTARQ
jgi:hypothetical protein